MCLTKLSLCQICKTNCGNKIAVPIWGDWTRYKRATPKSARYYLNFVCAIVLIVLFSRVFFKWINGNLKFLNDLGLHLLLEQNTKLDKFNEPKERFCISVLKVVRLHYLFVSKNYP
jgi:hypothetical protein